MNDPFQTQFRPELSLKRRSHSVTQAPMESMESDSNTPFDTSDTGPHGLAALQASAQTQWRVSVSNALKSASSGGGFDSRWRIAPPG